MYIVARKVKQKAKSLGFRTEPGYLSALNLAIDVIIEHSVEWTKPKKTMTRESLTAFLSSKGIKL
jgi:hypothetical protein